MQENEIISDKTQKTATDALKEYLSGDVIRASKIKHFLKLGATVDLFDSFFYDKYKNLEHPLRKALTSGKKFKINGGPGRLGPTIFMHACVNNDKEMMRLLVEDFLFIDINKQDMYMSNPLFFSIEHKRTGMIKFILDMKGVEYAKKNAMDCTPLQLAKWMQKTAETETDKAKMSEIVSMIQYRIKNRTEGDMIDYKGAVKLKSKLKLKTKTCDRSR